MGISLKPSEAVQGGVVPLDRFLTYAKARFNLFDYTNKAGEVVATTVALRLETKDDDGQEYTQQYSVGDPKDFSPSEDNQNPAKEGKYLIAIGQRSAISQSSNFYILTSNLVNAGFPENKLGDDISAIEGTEAYHSGIPEPKRSGLVRTAPADGARERVISVPTQIRKLPWEKGAKGKAQTAAGAKKNGGIDSAVLAETIEFVKAQVENSDDGTVTRTDLASTVFAEKKGSANLNAIAKAIFTPELAAELVKAGYVVEGDDISKAG